MAMNKTLKLTLDLPKSINFIYGRNKFGSTYLKKEGKDYKKKMIKVIQIAVEEQQWTKVENQFLYLDEVVYMNKVGRDSDNLKKLTQDCLTESNIVWTDDTYCWARTQRVFIDSLNPRLEIILSVSPSMGIFNDKEDYDSFINTYCNKCKKGNKIGLKGGCSIFKNAMESRIKEEIPMTTEEERQNKVCLKIKLK